LPKKHRVIILPAAKEMLSMHARFLKRESLGAAHRLMSGYGKSIARIADNPFQFPFADELDIPNITPNTYRKCLFEIRYKALFRIKEGNAFVVAIIDSRMENMDALGEY
jgi:plasmid stabilization system protein ParE